MSKQTELVGLARTTKLDEVNDAYDAGALSNRNMVINGAMNVAQRSSSVAGIASSGYYTCDRWQIGTASSAGRFTMTQTADGPNGISANCIKLDCTTADTSIAAGETLTIQHRFEGQNLQRIGKGVTGAKQVTVSFYIKANAAFTFGCELLDVDNSRQITKLFDTTTDWNRIELTFPTDVDDGSSPFDDDNAQSLRLSFWLHAGATYTGGTLNTAAFANTTAANRAVGIDSFFSNTDNNFFITGVQMEVGDTATPFEHRSYGDELQRCQRYYERISTPAGSSYQSFGVGHVHTGTQAVSFVDFKVLKRATPTASYDTASNFSVLTPEGSASACSAISTSRITPHSVTIALVSSSIVQGDATLFLANNTAKPFIDIDAEL